MSSDLEPMRLRERRRAETVSEIKHAALSRMAEGGHDAMTLRAVARDVGVSVQALYHYFPSRDALLTTLIVDSYNELADAVQSAIVPRAASREGGAVAAGLAYRRWAMQHRSQFLLALGVPLSNYAAPQDGPTTAAASRLGQVFHEALFAGWTAADLARVPLLVQSSRLEETMGAFVPAWPELPPGAFAFFTYGWATLHGLVMLELLGHLPWLGDAGADMCRASMVTFTTQLEAFRPHRPPPD